jgi:hypothetical protein
LENDKDARFIFRAVADALSEVGYPVRCIVVVPDTSGAPDLVPAATPSITSDSVSRALTDAEGLLHQTGAAMRWIVCTHRCRASGTPPLRT